jgi:hypothetical protein
MWTGASKIATIIQEASQPPDRLTAATRFFSIARLSRGFGNVVPAPTVMFDRLD